MALPLRELGEDAALRPLPTGAGVGNWRCGRLKTRKPQCSTVPGYSGAPPHHGQDGAQHVWAGHVVRERCRAPAAGAGSGQPGQGPDVQEMRASGPKQRQASQAGLQAQSKSPPSLQRQPQTPERQVAIWATAMAGDPASSCHQHTSGHMGPHAILEAEGGQEETETQHYLKARSARSDHIYLISLKPVLSLLP